MGERGDLTAEAKRILGDQTYGSNAHDATAPLAVVDGMLYLAHLSQSQSREAGVAGCPASVQNRLAPHPSGDQVAHVRVVTLERTDALLGRQPTEIGSMNNAGHVADAPSAKTVVGPNQALHCPQRHLCVVGCGPALTIRLGVVCDTFRSECRPNLCQGQEFDRRA